MRLFGKSSGEPEVLSRRVYGLSLGLPPPLYGSETPGWEVRCKRPLGWVLHLIPVFRNALSLKSPIFLLFCVALSILSIQAPMPSPTVSDRLHERFRFFLI